MKNSKIKILPIIGAVALLAGCSDDLDVRQIVPGEEIHFAATGSFESGNPQARTIYGEVVNDSTMQQINWVPNVDIIDIAYPEAAQKKLIAYDVLTSEDHTKDPSKSTAQILAPHKDEPMGLQWGTPTNGFHHFYAVYPSSKMFSKGQIDGTITMDAKGLNGYMPNAQEPKAVKQDTIGVDYYIEPDMRYAYMVAQTAHAQNAGDNVSLDFHPLVTALEFTVIAAEVENNVSGGKMTLQGIRLQSVSSNICGSFSYKFQNNPNYTVTDANGGASGFDQIYMDIPNGIELTKDKKFNFTFFVLPTKKYDPKDLKLTFVYLDNKGNLTYKTAAINKNIEMRKKYFFNNVSLKAISSDAQPSKWFSMLDGNIKINQLSIPVAGNAFTNDYNDADAAYHKQQVTDYMKLWNQGVRGFELVTDWNADFGGQYFVGGEKVLDSSTSTPSPTFDTAVTKLMGFLANDATKNETLILICHYHPVKAAMNPQNYVTYLMGYFNSLIGQTVTDSSTGGTHTVAADDFVLLTGNSTVNDLRGKVAIVIRPGDDDYMKMAKLDNTNCPASSDELKLSGTLGPKMLLIKNWGSAYDRWDKRYVGAVREATWADRVSGTTGMLRIEEYIYGCSGTNASGYGFKDWTGINKLEVNDAMFAQKTSETYDVYVQEWCRVVPQILDMNPLTFKSFSGGGDWTAYHPWNTDLQAKWPASIDDKKNQIDYLFKKSVQEKNSVCINVLSGYYITDKHMVSVIPFKEKYEYPAGKRKVSGNLSTDTYKPSGQGNGGNYAGLAADLNTYVYEKLQKDAYGVGPLGLVQIDFIGATQANFDDYDKDKYNGDHGKAATASQNLVPFIAMNNFRFPMERNPSVQMGTSDEKVDETIEGE